MVSVAILTYNQEAYIGKTIESVLNQITDFDYEIVIGEDCSTDRTRSIVLDYQKNFPSKIRVVTSEQNLGLLRNTKNTYDACYGKYLCPLGGDDLFSDKHKLSKQVELLESHEEYGLVHSNGYMVYDIDPERNNKKYHTNSDFKIINNNLFERLLAGNFIIASSACFRKSLYEKYINFENFYNLGFLMEDFPSWLELSKHTKFAYIDECLVTCLRRNNSVSRPTEASKRYKFIKSVYDVKFYYIKKYGCSEELDAALLEKYHFFNLKFSFFLGQKEMAKEPFLYLVRKKGWNHLSIDIYLYYFSSLNSIFQVLIKTIYKLKNIFIPKISFQRLMNNEIRD